MKWFKFYGQDWLTDTKLMKLGIEDRLCLITLLCLANSQDKGGFIPNCDEETIIKLTHLDNESIEGKETETDRARGCLERYEALQIVTLHRNGGVTLNNFIRRQSEHLSNAERQKKYREKTKKGLKNKDKIEIAESYERYNDRNARVRNGRNVRIEQNRIEINTRDKSREPPKKKLSAVKGKNMKKNHFSYNEANHTDAYEDVIDAETGERQKSEKKPQPKNKLALNLVKHFGALCENKIGTHPVKDAKAYYSALRAVKNLKPKDIDKLLDEWFSSGRENADLIQITQAFSNNQINRFKAAYGK